MHVDWAGRKRSVRKALVTGTVLLALAPAGCGRGSDPVETSSGAPPRDSYLKADFEHRFQKQNDPSALKCEGPPTVDVMAYEEEWNCSLTTASGKELEVVALVGVTTGNYSILECRTSPDQKYSQTPRGVCKKIR
jgi:hypothetical protein